MRPPEKSALRNDDGFDDEKGFTLIEMLIVAAIACFLAPISFLTFSHLSDEMTMRHFAEEIRETLADAQMDAIAESTAVVIIFNTETNRFYVSKPSDLAEYPMNPRIEIMSSMTNVIRIDRSGHFSRAGTCTFTLGRIQYNLVVLVGQGRFYIEKKEG
ncbi:prepilin-type N-terminal cleavage/methylation domain-containing protein [Sporolactobacillus sp. THM7-7]|nr:prepilin-type N-terminal cleavage/methylation domain-containing protein [Sporolactobacillus sp. THM7-7]